MGAVFVRGFFVVLEPDVDSAKECPACGFDALLAFPVKVLSRAGVGDFGTYERCVRCHKEGEGG